MKNKIFPLIFAAGLVLPLAAPAQSLWRDDISRNIVADKRATGVGDIITINISENTTTTKNNETSTERSSSLTSAITSFLFPGFLEKAGSMPSIAYSSDHKHDGKGAINDTESIVAQVAVQVIDVLPNGNLVIEGRSDTEFAGEKQSIVLHGTVRSDDVAPDDTVMSYNVANATVQILGKGTVTDSQNKGWFNRIWDKVNPF
jgi:flagellar L-ring protein FlgH